MTRAAVAKLLILVILAFIICLPEFFTLNRASKVSFLCLPYRPCEPGTQVKRGVNGKIEKTKARHEGRCDPSHEKLERACEKESQSRTAGSGRGGEDRGKSWFMCETDVDMSELQRNTSSSGVNVYLEVSVELQLKHEQTLNLTLFGQSNLSSLHLLPPEKQEEEEVEEEVGNDRQLKAFYCCLSVRTQPRSANQSRCLLLLSNQTVSNATAKEEASWERTVKGEWRCVLRALWLALLCLVLLVVFTAVIGQIYSKKKLRQPVRYNFSSQQLQDAERYAEDINPKVGMTPHPHGSRSRSGLSPIQEIEHQDDRETLLDGNIDNCYTVNLHHRGHPSTSEEWPQ